MFGSSTVVLTAALAALLLGAAAFADELFDRWDGNGDGRLTKEELPEQLRGNFEWADRDGDGYISLAEHEAALGRRGPENPQQGRPPMAELPSNVILNRDLPYAGTDNPRQMLDLLLPKGARGPLPVIVFIHGGAWLAGDKSGGIGRLAPLVATGKYAGATVGYRLSDEARWPAQIHDCKAAIRWLKGNASKYGLDPEKIAVWGASAGGHLVAMLGVSGDVPELEGELGDHLDQSSRVTCVLDWFGPANFLTMNDFPGAMDHNAPTSPESRLIGGPIQEHPDLARNASPLTYVTPDDPPFLIAHGSEDNIVPFGQSVELYEKLHEAGVEPPPLLIRMVGAGHGTGVGGPELHRRVVQFLDMHLCGIPAEISEEPIPADKNPGESAT